MSIDIDGHELIIMLGLFNRQNIIRPTKYGFQYWPRQNTGHLNRIIGPLLKTPGNIVYLFVHMHGPCAMSDWVGILGLQYISTVYRHIPKLCLG